MKHMILKRIVMFKKVAPLAGAWIETPCGSTYHRTAKSHPSRVRGLKPQEKGGEEQSIKVAPLAGAWIETPIVMQSTTCVRVAPLAGAWIETKGASSNGVGQDVAPLAGAWIETID